jgi:hypothetical protein
LEGGREQERKVGYEERGEKARGTRINEIKRGERLAYLRLERTLDEHQG